MIAIGLCFCFITAYLLLLIRFFRFNRVNSQEKQRIGNDFTILVPVKSSEKLLQNFLLGLRKFLGGKNVKTIIVLNGPLADYKTYVSQFETAFNDLNLTFIHLPEPEKKRAIMAGAREVSTKNIWLMDVDIIFNPTTCIQDLKGHFSADLLAFPIDLKTSGLRNFLGKIQEAEWSLLQFLTHNVKHSKDRFMVNGACLWVKTKWLKAHNPYADNFQFRTGDDVYLLAYIKKNQGVCASYASKPFVSVKAPSSWPSYFKQRIRWASKNYDLAGGAFTMGKVLFLLRFIQPFLMVAILFSNHPLFFFPAFCYSGLIDFGMCRKSPFALRFSAALWNQCLPFVYLPILGLSFASSLRANKIDHVSISEKA